MASPKKTKDNPYGLTQKQRLVVADMLHDIESGRGVDPTKSHKKIYNPKNTNVASTMAAKNIQKVNFRQALVGGLVKRKILGQDSKVEEQLKKGLKAVKYEKIISGYNSKGSPIYETVKIPDDRTRLEYIKEINKVAGVYAPEKKQVGKLNINLDLTKEKLQQRMQELEKQLDD